jgi:hypothetical protein
VLRFGGRTLMPGVIAVGRMAPVARHPGLAMTAIKNL